MNNLRSVFGIVMGLLAATAGRGSAQGPEIDIHNVPVVHPTAGSTTTPITHQPYFLGERDLFGYCPRYTPAPVNFDPDNVPYIRVGVNPDGYDVYGEFTTLGIIQTLDAGGQWIHLTSWLEAVKAQYPGWDGVYHAGTSNNEQIIFDGAGDAYTIVNTWYNATLAWQSVLLYSRDKCRTWQVYPLPHSIYHARLELPEAWNDTGEPPVLLGSPYQFTGGPLYLILPRKTSSGRLILPARVTLTSESDNVSAMAPMHSGMGNATITKDNRIHVVFLQNAPSPDGTSGTPQYIVTYDRVAKTITGPVFLGTSDNSVPDTHDGPAITIDSQGYLHVILGAHGGRFQYTRSLVPNSITGGWTPPIWLEHNGDVLSQWTYISLLCDKNDTLHVVGRYSGHGYFFGLWYMRKKAGQAWEENLGPLVMPFRRYYSCWYHKLTMDRQGRLFLSYIYFGDQFDRGTPYTYEIDAYRARWPWEEVVLVDPVATYYSGQKAHEPCVLMSDDGGDHWRLALTTSLQTYFSSNTFENGLDGWTLAHGPAASPIQAVSSYTYNGKTLAPRTGETFARAEAGSGHTKATRTLPSPQHGVFTGYINLLENVNVGMIRVRTASHEYLVLANSTAGRVSYRIDATETATPIAVSTETWHEVKIIAGPAGTEGYWDGTLLFRSPHAETVTQISFGSEWSSAPCGFDDFSFVPVTTVQGTVNLSGFGGSPAGMPVTVKLLAPGTSEVRETCTIPLDSAGRYWFYTSLTGVHDVWVKAPHWLAETAAGVTLGAEAVNVTMTRNGDANNDNVVGFADFSILQNHYGRTGQTGRQGDFNGDTRVSFEDFSILQNHYGQSGTASGSPLSAAATGGCGSLGLALLAAIGLACLSTKP